MNIGGHKHPDDLKKLYRNSHYALEQRWKIYMGVLRVYFDGTLVLTTPSEKEAKAKFEQLKQKCIRMKCGNAGQKALEKFVSDIPEKERRNEPIDLEYHV